MEAFLLLIDSNISFTEHPETSLTHDLAVTNRVACPQSVLVCSGASSRKTDLETYATNLLLNSPSAPESWAKRYVLVTDATKKGAELLLVNHREGIVSSSEACNTIYVPKLSSSESGIQYLSRQRICQWTQSESVSTSTGKSQCPTCPKGQPILTTLDLKTLKEDYYKVGPLPVISGVYNPYKWPKING